MSQLVRVLRACEETQQQSTRFSKTKQVVPPGFQLFLGYGMDYGTLGGPKGGVWS